MKKVPLIDIHTHRIQEYSNTEISVFNVQIKDCSNEIEYPETSFSIGIHPWDVTADTPKYIKDYFEGVLFDPNIIGVGECGLDRTCDVDFALQKEVFLLQAHFAELFNLPLIIHCVKSYSDLLELRKDATVPWILHGYSGNKEQTEQLIDKGFFFSLGSSLTNSRFVSSKKEMIQKIPLERLFLETDEASIDIQQVYKAFCTIRKMPLDKVAKQIQKNFLKYFDPEL